MKGILLVDKPEGWTSFDVVNYVRKMVANIEGKKPRNVKVGHTGTLDPAATGLLVLCIGKEYTTKVPQLIKQDKVYEVELTLGKTSSTGDKEGEIIAQSTEIPEQKIVEKTIQRFTGEIMQSPPTHSAVKINGIRAYKLARDGKEFSIEPRPVTVHAITDVRYGYPHVLCTAHVGSGTYIRSLAQDIGDALGCGAYMSNLRRTAVGTHTIREAYSISELSEKVLEKALEHNR